MLIWGICLFTRMSYIIFSLPFFSFTDFFQLSFYARQERLRGVLGYSKQIFRRYIFRSSHRFDILLVILNPLPLSTFDFETTRVHALSQTARAKKIAEMKRKRAERQEARAGGLNEIFAWVDGTMVYLCCVCCLLCHAGDDVCSKYLLAMEVTWSECL